MSEIHDQINPETYMIQGIWEILYDDNSVRLPVCREPMPLSKFEMAGLKIVSARKLRDYS